MMEENNNIFLAGGNALLYLAKPVHEKYSTTFVWGHPFSRYVSYDQFFNSSPPVHTCTQFDDPSPFPQLRTYLARSITRNSRNRRNPRKIIISFLR